MHNNENVSDLIEAIKDYLAAQETFMNTPMDSSKRHYVLDEMICARRELLRLVKKYEK